MVVTANAASTEIDRFVLDVSAVGLVESVAVTENVFVPAAVGVPVIAPVPALRLNPAGRAPEVTSQVIGAVPPVEASVAPG